MAASDISRFWFVPITLCGCIRAAGSERASRRGKMGDVGNGKGRASSIAVQSWDRREEELGVGMGWGTVEGFRFSGFYELALVHYGNA